LHVADIVKEGKDITLIGWGAQVRILKEVFIEKISSING